MFKYSSQDINTEGQNNLGELASVQFFLTTAVCYTLQ